VLEEVGLAMNFSFSLKKNFCS